MFPNQSNVLVLTGEDATFDPPIDGILVVSAVNTTATVGGQSITLSLTTGPVTNGLFGPGAVVPLPGCTQITGQAGLAYLALRRYRAGKPINDIIG